MRTKLLCFIGALIISAFSMSGCGGGGGGGPVAVAPTAPAALERLEVIADAYLSVSGPAQLALPGLLARREAFLAPLRARLAANRAAVDAVRDAPLHGLPSGGGWSAVLRIGETLDEEQVCLELLADGVAVQPGFFYDFERPGHLVVSLLPEPEVFREGLARVVARLRR